VKPQARKLVAENRKARFNYFIDEVIEAGLALVGTEVKSLREGRANMSDAYATEDGGEIVLLNCHIPEYAGGNRFNHEPKRPRKLLLHKKQINQLLGTLKRGGVTLVPLSLYFNERGRAKLELALARGKQLHDKRATERDREWKREQGRLLRPKG
jgi:SsrA-binding protein